VRLRWLIAVTIAACSTSGDGTPIALPNGPPGIGFDDLRFSTELHRVVVPGGRAGKVYLIDPDTKAVTAFGGFSTLPDYGGGHDDSATSADVGRGLLFVTDRTSQLLSVLDAHSGAHLSSVRLGSGPDYVRWVAATDELWVSEPSGSQLEIFALEGGNAPRPVATLPITNGPESLVIDQARGRAYTHHWQRSTMGFDVRTRTLVGEWPNGCAASRGIEVEPEHGWVFAACSEGTLTVLDPSKGGRILDALPSGAGYDVMGYAPVTRHAFLAGSACGCLSVLGLSPAGKLDFLGRFDAPTNTHCAVADDRGHGYACAPESGTIEQYDDSFPSRAQ
jgi:hypothetical protein